MSKMEDNMDKALALFYRRGRMESRQLFMLSESQAITDSLGTLVNEGYLLCKPIGLIENIYEITAKGRAFHEKGGFSGIRKDAENREAAVQAYNREMRDIAREANEIALLSQKSADRANRIAFISAVLAVIAIILTILQLAFG